jgi:ATP-dependent RNA helicase RhlE
VSLAEVQIFILDEADRMLDMGFIRDIKRILKMLPQQRQNLMFSATYSDDIRQLANQFLRSPTSLQVTPRNATADRVEQSAYRVPKDHKRHLLAHLIIEGNWHQVLVFTRTKHGANRLTQQLERAGINAMAIHGNKSQNARVKALQDFKENRITALVATEVAARGLDIKELPHVVNYELPNVPEDYVHRIGRTARAGSTGAAISLVSPDELSYLRDIEKLLKRKIDFVEPPKFEIKEGTHQPRNATGEHEPHQDPRRRPEHRRSGGGGRHGGGRSGGGNRGAGRADHAAYMQGGEAARSDAPRSDAPRSDAQPGARPHGSGNHGGGNRHGGQGGRGGGGRHKGGGAPGASRGGSRGGFARGARSGGGRSGGGSAGGGQSGGGQSGSGNGGGFSRMT